MDKTVKRNLKTYADIFYEGRQKNINEADTVMYLVRFFTDVLGYDLFSEITKEFQIRERYCDLAVKIDGEVKYLVEAKVMPTPISDRHIEQAENYASRAGIPWVVLTNGLFWRLYHLTFDSNGIEHDQVFEVSLTPDSNLKETWTCLQLLSRESLVTGKLDEFLMRKKTLNPTSLVRALFTESVLHVLRRELHRDSKTRLDVEEVMTALRRLLNPEVLTEDVKIRKVRRKKRKKTSKRPKEEGSPAGQSESSEDHGEELEADDVDELGKNESEDDPSQEDAESQALGAAREREPGGQNSDDERSP